MSLKPERPPAPRSGASKPEAFRAGELVRATLIVAGIVLLIVALWQLADLILLGFGAVVVATILRSLAGLIERVTPLKDGWSLALGSLLVAGLIGSFVYLLGAQIYAQGSDLIGKLPGLVSGLGDRIGIPNLNELVAERSTDFLGRSGLVGNIAGYTSVVISALANFVVVIVAGIYFAASPERYRKGFLKLVPAHVRDEAGRAMDNASHALQLWLLGQVISMILIGILTTIGLYLLGMPSALALGFFAGVAEFVPVVGPLLSAVPAILVALSEGGTTVFWVIGLYILVQQAEGNLIMPLVQRRAVDLPPVVTLFALAGLGILFGPLGVLFGAPLAVVMYVAVQQLYVRDTLGEKTNVPGEEGKG